MISRDEISEMLTPPTTTVEKAAKLLGLSRSFAYEAAARGDIKTVRMGGKLLVLTAPLRKQFEIEN